MKAGLFWFPIYPHDWLGSSVIATMSPEQEGVYFRLLALAWGNGTEEPSLPDDDAQLALASRMHRRWLTAGRLVRAQFEVRDGRLYNAKLSQVWRDQLVKQAALTARARAGGRAKAAIDAVLKQRPGTTASTATSMRNLEVATRPPKAAVVAPVTNSTVDDLLIDALVDGNTHGELTPRDDGLGWVDPPRDVQDAERGYESWLGAEAEAWEQRDPVAVRALKFRILQQNGANRQPRPDDFKSAYSRGLYLTAVAEALGLPDNSREWAALQAQVAAGRGS